MDYFDSNLVPLLKGEIENDYQELQKNKKQILNLIKDLNKDIDKLDLKKKKKESMNSIKDKFEELEKNMKKFSQGMTSIQSFTKKNIKPNKKIINKKKYKEEEEDVNFNNEENLLSSLLEISSLISHQSQNLYKKFENKIKQAENKFEDIEISSSFDKRKSKNTFQIKEKSVNKEKLKMEQKEYQQLLEKSKNILTISENIKKLTQKGEDLINNIGSNVDSIEDNIINGNEELEKYKNSRFVSNKYYWIGGGLIIIIIIIVILIYVKYNAPNKNKVTP